MKPSRELMPRRSGVGERMSGTIAQSKVYVNAIMSIAGYKSPYFSNS